MDAPPMATVDTVGVKKRLCILANAEGIALYTAIDNVVRAVGRIVVCVDAAADVSTMKTNKWLKKDPKPDPPKTELPRTWSTSLELLWFCSPIPLVPIPA